MLSTDRRACGAFMVLCVVAHAAAFRQQQMYQFPQQQMQQLVSQANPLPQQQNQFQKTNQIPQAQQLPQQQQQLPQGNPQQQVGQGMPQQQFPQGMPQQQVGQGMPQQQGMHQQQLPQGMPQQQGMQQQQFPQGMPQQQFPQGMPQQQFPQGMQQLYQQGMQFPQQQFQQAAMQQQLLQQRFPQAQFGQQYGQQFQQFNNTMMQTPVVPPKPAVPKRIAYIPPCQYLSSRPTPRGSNTGPFELETYSGGKNRIERGWPVQVTIKLWENSAYGFEKFSDFIIYAVTSTPAAAEGGAAEPYKPVGVFWMDPAYSRWWSGAKGFKCNRGSQGYDAVGSIESYTHDLYKAMFPGDQNLNSYKPRTRNIGKYLWLPSESAMGATGITFHAKINIRGEWFKLTSPTWPVYNPPSPEEIRRRQLQQFINLRRQMAEYERRANAAEAAAQAPP